MTKLLAIGGDAHDGTIIYFMGRIYVAQRFYALNGGLLAYTPGGVVYVNPDGREVWG